MKQLLNSQGKVILANLKVATSFIERARGLIGTKDLPAEAGVLFYRCNSIHTCFMSMNIDCIFLDRDLRVKKIVKDVKPWRLVLPILGAKSVIELKAGNVDRLGLVLGEELHVST